MTEQQSQAVEGVHEELDLIVAKLEAHRLKVVERMAEKLDVATYRDLTDVLEARGAR